MIGFRQQSFCVQTTSNDVPAGSVFRQNVATAAPTQSLTCTKCHITISKCWLVELTNDKQQNSNNSFIIHCLKPRQFCIELYLLWLLDLKMKTVRNWPRTTVKVQDGFPQNTVSVSKVAEHNRPVKLSELHKVISTEF